ncbi:DtxR family iron (metal) dependent repressor [Candidatus Omnitrophus magneticus]|uniref:DtxR family iron (Metal) dependent repressor n=1 Tax=Candidatus Omnitrophus magneticus TaxID=1609969 RepID=A0A0F0CP93_9BACT|nr:DtxR family iron (metal) dependent repressor [Candidatus Omnitrophus magneticus]
MLTDKQEHILADIWIEIFENKKEYFNLKKIEDIADAFELAEKKYITISGEKIILEYKGWEEAKSAVRRKRLAERLLMDVLDVKKNELYSSGCKFEHLLRKGLDDNICALLGHPKTCPHGKPIPEGKCCSKGKGALKKIIMPLTELEIGKKAKVAYLETKNHNALQKAIVMGILPNIELSLICRFPSYVIQHGKSQFAVDKEFASEIYVRIV